MFNNRGQPPKEFRPGRPTSSTIEWHESFTQALGDDQAEHYRQLSSTLFKDIKPGKRGIMTGVHFIRDIADFHPDLDNYLRKLSLDERGQFNSEVNFTIENNEPYTHRGEYAQGEIAYSCQRIELDSLLSRDGTYRLQRSLSHLVFAGEIAVGDQTYELDPDEHHYVHTAISFTPQYQPRRWDYAFYPETSVFHASVGETPAGRRLDTVGHLAVFEQLLTDTPMPELV